MFTKASPKESYKTPKARVLDVIPASVLCSSGVGEDRDPWNNAPIAPASELGSVDFLNF